MNYIISGHKGQIGRELQSRIKGNCIMQIDLKEGNNMNNIEVKGLTADIFFHLASFCKIRNTIRNPILSNIDANSTFKALEICRLNNIPKFVYFSSVRVLSHHKTPYSACKKYGEELVKAYCECYGINYLIIRPSSVYGGFDETNRLMNIWLNNAKQNKDLIIYGNKGKSLNFTHIIDFMVGLNKAILGEWNQEYNICGDSVKLTDIAKEIIKQTNSKSKIIYEAAEKGQPQKGTLKPTNNKINYKEGIKLCLK